MIIILIIIVVIFVIIISQSNSTEETQPHYTNDTITGYVYIISNESFKDSWVKIGMTTRSVEDRIREFNTATPLNFYIITEIACPDPYSVEQDLHARLDKYRPRKRKEFFKIDHKTLKEELSKIDYLNLKETENED